MRASRSEPATLVWPKEHVRNICILAHVDHGKTTCADNLISSNGIISRASAGKIRYLDSRVDEQERQITMKSSSIALRWRPPGEQSSPTYLVNLIDSPGHVDFTSEVSTAARLADGALVVVDVVEGVEAQTRTVLRQAYRDRVKTVLLLNKVDRLIVELELEPAEAYQRIQKILEQINAANQQLLSEEVMAKDPGAPATTAATGDSTGGEGLDLAAALEFDMAAEEAWCYAPERGNVAFGSAAHGWAFRVDTFAKLIASKMGAKPENLQKVLWGDWAYNKKTKRVQRRNPADAKSKPMFVEFVLQQVFSVYEAAYKAINLEQLKKMQAQIPSWRELDLERLVPGGSAMRDLCSRWLPFADCVLQMAAEQLPSPPVAAPNRLPVLCPRWFAAAAGAGGKEGPIADGLRLSDPAGACVAYLAKFLAADLERCVLTGDALVGDEDVKFVGICRVFAGTLRPGQDLFVMAEEGVTTEGQRTLRLERLFLLMGRFMEEVPEAPAGSIAACFVTLGGVAADSGRELGVERALTLCDAADGPCFETPYSSQAFAIVRVSIEPQNVADLDALDRGLRLLHRADPSVSVEAMVTGENVLGCCGDEHLKRCIGDLQKLYARGIPLTISTPLVAVRESFARSISADRIDQKNPMWLPSWASHIVDASTEASSQFSGPTSEHEELMETIPQHQERVSMSGAGVTSFWTANRKVCLRISAAALPESILEWMDEHVEDLESVLHRQRPSLGLAGGRDTVTLDDCLREVEQQFGERLRLCEPSTCTGRICGMSVTKGSRAILLDASGSGWTLDVSPQTLGGSDAESSSAGKVPTWMRPSILSGFRMAAAAGPLCEEPVRGVAFILHSISTSDDAGASGPSPSMAEPYGPMSGQVMVAAKEACRYSLFRRGFARICEAMLRLEVNCEQEMLGKVYAVLGKRRAKVQDEGLRDGTSLFHISSFLPLADSFGLAHDLRAAASGHVSFHCAFSHWEQTEDDPFQEASLTPEELEELGDQPLPPNHARKLIDAIRKRKGLPTDEKVVQAATKQRTVTRMK